MIGHTSTDRRSGTRIPVSVPARLRTTRHEQSGRTVDISREGACIRCDAALLAMGERVTFVVGNDAAKGTVAWKGMDRIGIRFDAAMTEESLNAVLTARGY